MMDDALKSLTRRQLEDLQRKIERELKACILCGSEGATAYSVWHRNTSKASLQLCRPCFEKHRLPAGRTISPEEGVEDELGEGTLAE